MTERQHPLAGAVVAVAGGAGAAGRATLARLARAGATVSATGRDPDRLSEAVAEAEKEARNAVGKQAAGRITGTVADLSEPAAAKDWATQVERAHGRVDGLIHLVGGWRGAKTFDDQALQHWAELHASLLQTVQHTSLAFQNPLLRSPEGRYVIVSSTAVGKPTAGNAAYAAAKQAAEAWTLALADSLRKADESGHTAAVILVVKALVSQTMREERPDRKFPGFTDVTELADTVAELWDRPAAELNGQRLTSGPQRSTATPDVETTRA